MNFHENIRNDWKKVEKNQWGLVTKLLVSHLLIALEYQTIYQSNAKTHHSYLIVSLLKKLFQMYMNFIVNIRKKKKKLQKNQGVYLQNYSYLSC